MKLTIELVPSTCWYSNVRSNVSPGTWALIQRQVCADARQRCQICGRQGIRHPVEAHEVWAYHDGLRQQTLVGLVALCPDCHSVKHIGRALSQGTHARALAWFMRVNQLTAQSALDAIRAALAVHKERSQHLWRLDVSLLANRYSVSLDPNGRERGLA